jgi:hypothetical protein
MIGESLVKRREQSAEMVAVAHEPHPVRRFHATSSAPGPRIAIRQFVIAFPGKAMSDVSRAVPREAHDLLPTDSHPNHNRSTQYLRRSPPRRSAGPSWA